jgi:hypothetical protein
MKANIDHDTRVATHCSPYRWIDTDWWGPGLRTATSKENKQPAAAANLHPHHAEWWTLLHLGHKIDPHTEKRGFGRDRRPPQALPNSPWETTPRDQNLHGT